LARPGVQTDKAGNRSRIDYGNGCSLRWASPHGKGQHRRLTERIDPDRQDKVRRFDLSELTATRLSSCGMALLTFFLSRGSKK